MNELNFEYVPLTFISDRNEIRKQIRNTIILIYLFEKYNDAVPLSKLIEGTQYGHNASALKSGKHRFLRITDIHESEVNWNSVPFCNCNDAETYLLKKDDILIARTGGTTGKSFKIDQAPANAIFAGYLIRIRAKTNVLPDYIYMFLHSFAYWSQITNLNERNFRPKANAENLKALLIPNCPPIIQEEIIKIAEGIELPGYDELFKKIEITLNEFDKTQQVKDMLIRQLELVNKLKQAILQEATSGKVVPQNPSDGNATDLIDSWKLKTKKGLKGKFNALDQKIALHELPSSWQWCNIGGIADHNSGKTLDSGRNTGELRTYITTSNLYWGHFKLDAVKKIPIKHEELHKYTATKGDLLICEGGDAGRSAIWENDYDICFQNHVHRLRPYPGVSSRFIYWYLYKIYLSKEIDLYRKGMGISNLSSNALASIDIPLPPSNEQDRIVQEIEKQFAITENLIAKISENVLKNEEILRAVLHDAFVINERLVLKTQSVEPVLSTLNYSSNKLLTLAAEIVWQLHTQPTFGHLKLQKLIYLCQKTADMKLPTNFLKQAMGPYDPALMRSLDIALKENQWFEYQQGDRLKYKPLNKAGSHKANFNKYFANDLTDIQFLIDNFKSLKSEIIEIVATLYACLDTILASKSIYSEALLLQRFYEWSDAKEKFNENEVKRVFKRMVEIGLVPKSFKEII
jgi:type I restriction enzyme S subunit